MNVILFYWHVLFLTAFQTASFIAFAFDPQRSLEVVCQPAQNHIQNIALLVIELATVGLYSNIILTTQQISLSLNFLNSVLQDVDTYNRIRMRNKRGWVITCVAFAVYAGLAVTAVYAGSNNEVTLSFLAALLLVRQIALTSTFLIVAKDLRANMKNFDSQYMENPLRDVKL